MKMEKKKINVETKMKMESKDSLNNNKSQGNKRESKDSLNNNKSQGNKREKPSECSDLQCPVHGELSARGRIFEGSVVRKLPRRIAIEFERTVFIKKYERYAKKKTRVHARLPDCMKQVEIGDYVRVRECRPLSKIIHFVLIEILRKKSQVKLQGEKGK